MRPACALLLLALGCARAEIWIRVPSVTLEKVTLGPEGATVQWFVLDATVYGPDTALVSPSPITRFELWREDVASDRRTLLSGTLPESTRHYADCGLEPNRKYRYRLTFYVAEGKGGSVETQPFQTPPLWTYQFRNPMK